MTDIKIGDMVMVVKPSSCCNSKKTIGRIFYVNAICRDLSKCTHCGAIRIIDAAYEINNEDGCDIQKLIKINPPAKDILIQTEKECVCKINEKV